MGSREEPSKSGKAGLNATTGRAAGRRRDILRTAASLFARDGFHGVSIDDLGAAVGMSGPALYRYFPGKEAILAEMLVDISERLLAGGQERVVAAQQGPRGASAGSTTALLEALVDFHVDFALDEPDLIAVQFRDLNAMVEADQRTVRRLQARYVALWVDAVVADRTEVGPERARAAAHAVFGLINSTPHSARLSREDMTGLLRQMSLAALASA